MNLQHRIQILIETGKYMRGSDPEWIHVKKRASEQNAWFIPEFIDYAIQNITDHYLNDEKLSSWANQYQTGDSNGDPKNIGIVMAGNIPLVGYHDFLCAFVSGHKQTIKLSSKDEVLLPALVEKMASIDAKVNEFVHFAPNLKGCDAYIATGSNNSARYFEYYFKKYPHLIRKNRTSVGILDGRESEKDLELFADDVNLYFGLGCRNVSKIFVPKGYDFLPLLNAFRKYDFLIENHKYKHNYDYNLAIHIINRTYYMTNGSILLVESPSIFSPISQLHFEYYTEPSEINTGLNMQEVQCIVGMNHIPFGMAQVPELRDYADGVDTMKFLSGLNGSSHQGPGIGSRQMTGS
ncbi:MAG: acyl-CoA reductase [Bacteroidetes bacterium]|nr:MAG: acyl-CoA reductase [Bacteroidota bacterium]